MRIYEVASLIVLFLVGVFLWTYPIRTDTLPFGEGDAAWHFANGDWATKTDHIYWRLPFYISTWYYGYNKILGPGALEYPPPYHVGYSLAQIVGGERFVPVYILIAISSFLGAFAVYLLLRKLYDFPTAIIAATAMVFSFREILVYLWGQRPTILSFAFVPLILYCSFKYFDGYYKKEPKAVYFYLSSLLLIAQYLIHPQGLMLSLLALLIFIGTQTFRKKQFPINKSNILHLGIILVIAVVICIPFFNIYRGAEAGVETKLELKEVHRLLDWMEVKDRPGYPNSMGGPPGIFYRMNAVYFPFYYVIVWMGILFLVVRRDDKDILILSWLVALYILIHADVIGASNFGRVSRMLMGETALFYSIMAIGVTGWIKTFAKEDLAKKLIIGITITILIGLTFYNGYVAYTSLRGAYPYPLRISQEQYDTAKWIDSNLPQDTYIYYVGVMSYPKQRFMYILSHRPGIWQNDRVDYPWMNVTNILIDYSDAVKTNNRGLVTALATYEQQFINSGREIVYNQSNIHIWDIRGAKIGIQ